MIRLVCPYRCGYLRMSIVHDVVGVGVSICSGCVYNRVGVSMM